MNESKGSGSKTPLNPPFFRMVGFKLIIGMLILNSSILALTYFATQRITNNSFEAVATHQLQETLQFSHNFILASGHQLEDISKSYEMNIHHIEVLAEAFKTGQRNVIKSAIHEHFLSSESIHFILIDHRGKVMYRTENPAEYGDSLAGLEIVQNGLMGKTSKTKIINDLNQFKIAVVLPVKQGPEIVGLLITSSPINHQYIKQIKGTSDAELTVIRDRAVMGSTLTGHDGTTLGDLPLPYLEYQMMLQNPSDVLNARILGQRYLVMTKKIDMMDGNTPGSLMLAFPRKEIDNIHALLSTTFLYIFAATALTTLFFTWFLYQRISTPLKNMMINVENITNGIFDRFKVHNSKDEFGILSSSIYTMSKTISDNRNVLEAAVESRTAELTAEIKDHFQTEKELINQKEIAELANRAKSEFLANMSHELRTPLNSIIGFSQMMELETFGPLGNAKYMEYSGLIQGSANHLLRVIGDILDLSKIEAGKETVIFEDTEMPHLINESIKIVSGRAEEAGVTLAVEISTPFPLLNIDRIKVLQILLNLLSNSIKFTPTGGKITTKLLINENGECVLSVADTGMGIAKEELELVMQPFGQAGDAYTRANIGTGLGLSLVNSLTLLHDGYVTIESELGVGTTVTVVFSRDRTVATQKAV